MEMSFIEEAILIQETSEKFHISVLIAEVYFMKKQIINLIKQYEIENDFYGKVSEDDIKYVEESLGITFPESYKWFIGNYGSGGICGVDILGIEKKDNSSVFNATKRYRKLGLDSGCAVIEDLGEFIMCIDTNNENKVIRWDIATMNKEHRYDVFYEYLLDTFQEAIDNWD